MGKMTNAEVAQFIEQEQEGVAGEHRRLGRTADRAKLATDARNLTLADIAEEEGPRRSSRVSFL